MWYILLWCDISCWPPPYLFIRGGVTNFKDFLHPAICLDRKRWYKYYHYICKQKSYHFSQNLTIFSIMVKASLSLMMQCHNKVIRYNASVTGGSRPSNILDTPQMASRTANKITCITWQRVVTALVLSKKLWGKYNKTIYDILISNTLVISWSATLSQYIDQQHSRNILISNIFLTS